MSKETVKGTIDAEWLAVEVTSSIYNKGKAHIFNVLESIYADAGDPRLRANKKLVESILNGICNTVTDLVVDVLGEWKQEVEMGGEVSPEDAAETKRDYDEARKVLSLPHTMDTDEVAADVSVKIGIDVDTVSSVLKAETEWMIEKGLAEKLD